MPIQRWLHISDLHFGYNRFTVSKMREELLVHAKEIAHVDYLFITGDLRYGKIANTGYPKETLCFIQDLQKALGVEQKNTFLVSGNHDVNRSDELKTLINKAKEDYRTSSGKISEETLKYIRERRKPFLSLYKKICGHAEPAIHYSIETDYFNIIHVNTALTASMDSEDGDLIIDTSLLQQMTKTINRDKPSIVLAHHHPDALRTDEQRVLEIILKESNAVLYLCGHKHVAMSGNIKAARQDKNLWLYLCGTNMDCDPHLDSTDMDVFVGEVDTNSLKGFIQAYKWSIKTNAWLPDSEFSFPQNGALDGKHFFPPKVRPSFSSSTSRNMLDSYYKYIQFECGEIQLNGLPIDREVAHNKFELDKLFVMPTFKEAFFKETSLNINDVGISVGLSDANKVKELSISDIIPAEGRFLISILSGPGGGKTTFLKWLTSRYCVPSRQTDGTISLPQRELFPLWIKCRDIDFRSRPTILEIISGIARRAELITDENSMNEFMEHVHKHIKNGSALLSIDGLDEINNDNERVYFINQLGNFLDRYSGANVIITSRISGFYAITACKFREFTNYAILPFKDSDIRKLCVEWHRIVSGDRDEIRKKAEQLAETIIRHKNIRALASNPLMLTTLLLVERRVGRLPTKRVALYTEAIQVLLETWNLEAYEPLDLDEVRYQLAYVAYQMMIKHKQTLTRNELVKMLVSARKELSGLISGADSYVEFIKKVERRSALLIQKGYIQNEQTSEVEAIYEFQHLTFQEYLAAYAVAQKCYPNAKRNDQACTIMKDFFCQKYMQEVILLSAVLLDRWSVEGLVDGIIDARNTGNYILSESEHLRLLLLQIVADEAPLTEGKRYQVYKYCFANGMRFSDISLIKVIINGKYSNEFVKYIKELDNEKPIITPSYYSVVQMLLENSQIDAYTYYCNNRLSADSEEVLNAISIITTALWIQSEEVLNSLNDFQKNELKTELIQFAGDKDSRIQKEALSGLRMSTLLTEDDYTEYFMLFVQFINKSNVVPRVCEYCDDIVVMRANNVSLTSNGAIALKRELNSLEVSSAAEYKELLTLQLIYVLYCQDEDWTNPFYELNERRSQIGNTIQHDWLRYKTIDLKYNDILKLMMVNHTIANLKHKEIQEYVLDVNREWERFVIEKRKVVFARLENEQTTDAHLGDIRDADYKNMLKTIDLRIAELEAEDNHAKKPEN